MKDYVLSVVVDVIVVVVFVTEEDSLRSEYFLRRGW
jgi:hypothetical protein